MSTYDNRVKIRFDLEQDEDGYPPFTVECVWAEPLGDGLFRIDNSPWYVRGVSWRDVVRATENPEGDWDFVEVETYGGHSTIRVISMNKTAADMESLIEQLQSLGCSYESQGAANNIYSFDVPPNVDYRPIRRMLEKGEQAKIWGFEEGCLQHAWE